MKQFPALENLPPLRFAPIYCARVWGGNLLRELLKRPTPEGQNTGEAWELSDRPESATPVAGGELDGVTLSELVTHYGRGLIGTKAPRTERFPLLLKLIDAGERLSLQVHPDEQFCRKFKDGSEPKTEMWYVIAARRGARILAGLSSRATRLQLQEQLASPEVENLLQSHRSEPGDAYFIPAGMLHAIGGGNLLLEIQQNSDTTFRLSDWGRVDSAGKSRRLDVDKALAATDFYNRSSPRISGVIGTAEYNRKFKLVENSAHFQVTELRLVRVWNDDTAPDHSFHLITAINGRLALTAPDNPERSLQLGAGETALLAAAFGAYRVTPLDDGETTVLKTTL